MESTTLGRDEILALPLLREYDFTTGLARATLGTIHTVVGEQIASHRWGVGELHLWLYLNKAFTRSSPHALGEIHQHIEQDFHDTKNRQSWMALRSFVDVSRETEEKRPCFLVRTLVKAYMEGLVSVPELFVNHPHYQGDVMLSRGFAYADARIHVSHASVASVQRRRSNVAGMKNLRLK